MGAARAKRQNIVMLLKRQRGPMPTAKSGDWRGVGEDLDPLRPLADKTWGNAFVDVITLLMLKAPQNWPKRSRLRWAWPTPVTAPRRSTVSWFT